ncbi:MAG: trypsin-like peptidase domain-containing protein [Clostridia bacterium]|nr:trypsin-like peptidase domain-containing protein [Clostridia bacterium]
MKKIRTILVAIALIIMTCTLSACQIFFTEFPQLGGKSRGTVDVSSVSINYSTGLSNREKGDLVDAVKEVYGSVVAIENLTATSLGLGCGVIVDVDVYTKSGKLEENCFHILTCFHVINGASELKVGLVDANGEYSYVFSSSNFAVSLVGGDEDTDIAVLKLDITDNPYGLKKEDIVVAKLMDIKSNKLSLAEQVFAIGNPGGALPGTVTSGIVSYINRRTSIEGREMTLIQLDAALNQGNSGGGLFNLYGELVGMVNGGNIDLEGANFAIPLEVGRPDMEETGIVKIMTELIENQTKNSYGFVEGRWKLGMVATEGTTSGPFGAQDKYVYVHSINEGSSIAKATASDGSKIKAGYIIDSIEVNGVKTKITDLASFEAVYEGMKESLKIGDTFKLILREKYSSLLTTSFTVTIE